MGGNNLIHNLIRYQLVYFQHIGLKIQQDKKNATSYSYGHAGNICPVDKKVIAAVDEHIEGEHIRCIQLKDDEDLDQLMEHFISIHAKAVVFVNTRDDFKVKAQHWPKQCAIPVLLLKASDGKELLSAVENSSVFGKVEVESNVDSTTMRVVTKEPTATKPLADNESRLGAKENRKRPHNFEAEVKQLMFLKNDTPIVVSEDTEVFTMVMYHFQHYEKMVRYRVLDNSI